MRRDGLRVGAHVMSWCLAAIPHVGVAQTDYRNLDAGRPLRVEDALVTPRWSLDVQLPNARMERYDGGVVRWRLEPKATFGVAPFSELEIRVPILYVIPSSSNVGAPRTAGVAGVAIGAVHAFGVETPRHPAFALASEVLVPAGSLASPQTTFAVKGIATKTFSLVRVHLDAGMGTYSVRGASTDTVCVRRISLPGQDPGCGFPIVPDIPCDKSTDGPSLMCGTMPLSLAAVDAPTQSGRRWFAIAGVDHAFGLSSTLVAADLVSEHLVGLYNLVDWTAEVGLRRQVNPKLVVDAGISRHFTGVLQSSGVTVGGTYAISLAH